MPTFGSGAGAGHGAPPGAGHGPGAGAGSGPGAGSGGGVIAGSRAPLQKSCVSQKHICFVPRITKFDSSSLWHLLLPEIVVSVQPFSTSVASSTRLSQS